MMMDHRGHLIRLRRGAAVTALVLGLAGCEQLQSFEMPSFFGGDDADATGASLAPAAGGSGETRDVEAPEVFQKTEAGLWDGRPSLGGVWVAHPDVDDPERAIIRNEENGRFVTGALFRRERENPGPALQVSSDAAEELGMLAGAPSQLTVTALRREDIPAGPAALTEDPTAGTDVALAPPAAVSETPLDVTGDTAAAVGAASVDALVGATGDVAQTGTVDAIASAASTATVTTPALPPGTGATAGTAAAIAAITSAARTLPPPAPAPAEVPTNAPLDALAPPPVSALPDALPPAPTAGAAAASASTIDAIAGAGAAVAAAEIEAGIVDGAATEAPLDARGAIAAPVPLPEPVTSGLEKPFVQVGIFSVEANANDAATTLRGDGISASVIEQTSADTAFWRVLVGPAPTAADRTAILAQVQALGFTDAYFVSN